MLERRLRIASGLVLAIFVTLHLANHALGVVSVQAMDRLREPLSAVWRSWPGTVALYGAFLLHLALALRSLYRRRTLRMPAWEAAQLLLGLAVVPLVALHATSARGLDSLLGLDVGYEYILAAIWTSTTSPVQQTVLVLVAWLHLCVGLHFWLRLRPWYPRAAPWLLAAGVLCPALALAGFVAGGSRVLERAAADPAYLTTLFAPFQAADPARRDLFLAGWQAVLAVFAALLAGVLLARRLPWPAGRAAELAPAAGATSRHRRRAGSDRAGGAARGAGAARLGVRRAGALHHLPGTRARRRRAAGAARRGRGARAGAGGRGRGRTPRLPASPARRAGGAAAAGAGRHRRRRARRRRRRGP